MKQWKKTVVAYTVAAGLVIAGTATTTIQTTYAAPDLKVVVPIQKSDQATIQHIKHLAASGKTVNSENFGLGSKIQSIKKHWGNPDEASDETYVYYNKRNINFVADYGKVAIINSTDKSYFNITYKEVKKTLGKAVKEVKGEDAVYVTYKAGKNTLTIAFYYDNAGTAPSTIKQVSVS
jgi:hypothetical protein